MDTEKIIGYLDKFTDWGVTIVPRVINAIVVIYIGLFLVKKFSKVIKVWQVKASLKPEISVWSVVSLCLTQKVFLKWSN